MQRCKLPAGGNAATGTKNTAIYDGCGTAAAPQETGYLYNFEQVTLKNGAQVSIDADPTLFPALPAVQKPFYSVNNLEIKEGSSLTTDNGQAWIWGDTVINGTWEQLHSQTADYNDIFVSGTTQIGSKGHLINHGTSNLKGAVTNDGVMAFMGWALLQNNYTANNGELRLPVVADGENYDTGTIPVQINGLSTGTTTVNTVDPVDWQTLKKPNLGDNYILSKKNTDAPAQDVFVLGNADAVADAWFLKRMANADGTDDYYMWQVANGIRVIFDKNGGDTEASPSVMIQDKVVDVVNHFTLPTVEPTRAGYDFVNWNTKQDGTGDIFTAATDVTENMTVYAQWKSNAKGDLKVSNTVSGSAGDTTKPFTFTVTVDSSINGTYGEMTFTAGSATFTLRHGESLTAMGLPADTAYTVAESDNEGYTVTANGATGTISKDGTAVAAFTNNREAPSTQPPTTSAPENPAGPTKPEPTTTSKPTATPQPATTPQPTVTPQPTATQATVPQTGDTTPLMLWVVLLVISAMGLAGCLLVRFRKKHYKN